MEEICQRAEVGSHDCGLELIQCLYCARLLTPCTCCLIPGVWRGLPVALKTMVFSQMTEANSEGAESNRSPQAIMEVAIAASVGHPNVVSGARVRFPVCNPAKHTLDLANPPTSFEINFKAHAHDVMLCVHRLLRIIMMSRRLVKIPWLMPQALYR